MSLDFVPITDISKKLTYDDFPSFGKPQEHVIIDHEVITLTFKKGQTQEKFCPELVCCQYIIMIKEKNNIQYSLHLCYENEKRNITIPNGLISTIQYKHKYFPFDSYISHFATYEPDKTYFDYLGRKPQWLIIELHEIPNDDITLEFTIYGYNILRICNGVKIRAFCNSSAESEIICGIKDSSKYHDTYDWKMFWTIEDKDIVKLRSICDDMKRQNKYISLYFGAKSWTDVFTEDESEKIKVYICGDMDFSPLQHAYDIGWIEGVKCLCDYKICSISGAGLPIINVDKFLRWYNTIYINNTTP
jgi:hypothetical protein